MVRQTLAETTQNPPVKYLYHGTSDISLNSIMAQGLKSPYLTSNYEKAGYYATDVAQNDGGEAIVLKVKVPSTANLRVDYNELDEPVNIDESEAEMKKKIQAAYKKYRQENPKSYDAKYKTISVDKHDYWVSLLTTQTVRYEGIIPFENVSFDGVGINEAYYTTWKKREIAEDISQFEGQEQEIANKLAKHFNIGKMAPLGSGTKGYAYYIPNNKVLKITTDKTEAAESFKIKGKKLKNISNIYDVYALHGRYEGFYVIISELLDKTEDIDNGEDWFDEFARKTLLSSGVGLVVYKYTSGKLTPHDITKIINDLYDYFEGEEYKAQVAEWYFKGLINIAAEFKKYNIITRS